MKHRRKRIPQPITREDLKKIIITILTEKTHYQFYQIRNAFMFYLAWNLGLRPKEVFSIRLEHIDLERGRLYIPASNNKQHQQDYMPLPKFLIYSLSRYLQQRGEFLTFRKNWLDNPYLFPSNYNRYLDRSMLSRILRAALKKAGLYQVSYIDSRGKKRANKNLYSLRHGFGTESYNKLGLLKTKILMRHKWIGSTLTYIHISEQESREKLIEELHRP